MSRVLWQPPAPCNMHVPMVELHYVQWLRANNVQDVHSIETKRAYLAEQGYDAEKHHLSATSLVILKTAEQFYFRRYVLNGRGAV